MNACDDAVGVRVAHRIECVFIRGYIFLYLIGCLSVGVSMVFSWENEYFMVMQRMFDWSMNSHVNFFYFHFLYQRHWFYPQRLNFGYLVPNVAGNPFVLAAARNAQFQNNAGGLNGQIGFNPGLGNMMAGGNFPGLNPNGMHQNQNVNFQNGFNMQQNPMGAFGQGNGQQRPRMSFPKFYPNMIADCRLKTGERISEDGNAEFVHVAMQDVHGIHDGLPKGRLWPVFMEASDNPRQCEKRAREVVKCMTMDVEEEKWVAFHAEFKAFCEKH